MDILIVDDEKSIRLTTSLALEAEGHNVETAEDGALALRRIKEENFDLVFLDLRLGDEDGLEILQKVIALKPQQLVTIFTAHASISTAVKATQLGAFDYLEKPFTPDQLRAILIKAHLCAGNLAEACQQYHQFKATLGDELGLRPSEDLARLVVPRVERTTPVRSDRGHEKAPL